MQGAIRQVIEPIFEKQSAAQSYGFRPGRSCRDALRRVRQLLREGHHYVVDGVEVAFKVRVHHREGQGTGPSTLAQRLLYGVALAVAEPCACQAATADSNLTPVAIASLLFWGRIVFGQSWYDAMQK
jgi:hypothetical protein